MKGVESSNLRRFRPPQNFCRQRLVYKKIKESIEAEASEE